MLSALVERGYSPVRLSDAPTRAYTMPDVRYARKLSISGLWFFWRAGLVFTSHALYGGRAAVRGQRMVLLWHGEVVKPVGRFDGDRGIPADVAPVCSPTGRAYRVAEFGLHPRQVPVVGAPRNDRLLSAVRRDVRERLGWAMDDVVWLWLPTYRTVVRGVGRPAGPDTPSGLPFSGDDLAALDVLLVAENVQLVIKPHPLAQQAIGGRYRNIRVLPQSVVEEEGNSLYEILAASDGLVTDVSSVWLDYLLLQRPIVFAFPDIEEYRLRRGLNLEPYEDWAAGPIVADVDAFARALARLRGSADPYAHRREAMLKRFHSHVDANSAERLLDWLGLSGPRRAGGMRWSGTSPSSNSSGSP
ncbi:MAG TPA: CDP-glycerol glycerophosphotransferase family protein [Propionibacteriaceae bacterium]|nr:CDP-glycerol glycerophosphotransferase family protein [Propionibacteriaceae bacterium]